MRRRVAVAAATVVGGGLLLAPLSAPAQATTPYDDRTILTQGHVDLLYIEKVAGQTTFAAHTDEFGNLAHDDLLVHADPAVHQRTVGAGVAAAVPGFTQGSSYYLLPQTSQLNHIFAGFGYSADIPGGTNVTYELVDYQGPGAFGIWQNSEEGPRVWMSSEAGAVKSFTSQANHEHVNWGFSALGEYKLTVQPTVASPGVAPEVLAPETVVVYVGSELPQIDPEPEPDTTVTITGLAAHYHAGGAAILTAVKDPAGPGHFHWYTRANAEAAWEEVEDAHGATYGFIVRTNDHGRQYKAEALDDTHTVVGTSDPVTVLVDDHGNDPVNGPTITATLAEDDGMLAISVPESSRDVDLGAFALSSDAGYWAATGELKPITVTDTRAADPGWSASARVRTFVTSDGVTLPGNNLGWAPKVLASSPGQQVNASAAVAPQAPGIGNWTSFATTDAGSGRGTASLGADLELRAPTTQMPGVYKGMLLLTVI